MSVPRTGAGGVLIVQRTLLFNCVRSTQIITKCVSDVHRFLGMTNQMSKFLTGLTDKTQPLRELLKSNTQWIWEDPQKKAFTSVKAAMCHSPVRAMFDPNQKQSCQQMLFPLA